MDLIAGISYTQDVAVKPSVPEEPLFSPPSQPGSRGCVLKFLFLKFIYMQRLLMRVALATCLFYTASFAGTEPHWRQLLLQGDHQHAARDLPHAEASYLAALAEAERIESIPARATCLNRLGLVYRAMGRYPPAERVSRHVLDLWLRHAPDNAQELLIARSNLGIVLHHEGKYHEAEQLLSEVLNNCETTLGPGHPDTATALNNLAAVYHQQGRLSEAERLYERAFDLRQNRTYDQAALLTGNNLALAYAEEGRFAEAESLFREVLTRMDHELGRQHEATATALHNLGLLCFRLGKKEEGLRYVGEALQIRDERLGPMHPEALESAQSYAVLLQQTKHKKEAAAYLTRIRASGRSALPQTVDVTSLLRQH